MKIISRKEAIEQGLNKYFTNTPCKNNHIAERYTTSGTCSGCLGVNRQFVQAAVSAGKSTTINASALYDTRRAALAEMLPIRLRAYAEDWSHLRSVAVAVMQLRYPGVLHETDAHDRKGGKDGKGGTLLYTILAHPSDHAYLKAEEGRLLSARAPDMTEARRRAFNIGQTLIAEGIEPVPEFKP